MDEIIENLKLYTTTDARNLASIVFYAVTAWVAVASYKSAKRTIFANERVEVFKLQLKHTKSIHSFFRRNVIERTKYAGMFNSNIEIAVIDACLGSCDDEKVKNTLVDRKNKLIEDNDLLFASTLDSTKFKEIIDKFKVNKYQAVIPKEANISFKDIYFTRAYIDFKDECRELIAEPETPKEVVRLINDFITSAMKINEKLYDVLQTLPYKEMDNWADIFVSWQVKDFYAQTPDFNPLIELENETESMLNELKKIFNYESYDK